MQNGLGKQDLENIFGKVGTGLATDVRVFLLGGGAMCFRNQKTATKDLDIVFESRKDALSFISVLKQMRFSELQALEKEYQEMKAEGIWVDALGHRFDIFVEKVCGALRLSESMKKRAELLGRFENLEVMIVSNEDVILFKGITERSGDVDDIAAIVRTSSIINWQTILDECVLQSEETAWHGLLYNKLEEIRERHGIDPPIRKKLLKLDRKALVKEAYERYIGEGLTKKEALEKLSKLGFTKKETENV